MVVCSIYKLFRNGKSFTKEGKSLERSDVAITRLYAEEQNANWKTLGYDYVIDEEKTAEFYEIKEQKRLQKIKNAKISKKVAENLSNMLDLGIEDVEVPKKVVKKKVEEIEVVDEEVIEEEEEKKDKITITGNGNLRVAYLEKFGKHVPVNKKNDDKWILDKLNDR